MSAITRIGTVIVPVTDQDEALEFYVGRLGFEKRIDGEDAPGERWVEVAPPGAATTIALVPKREGDPNEIEVSLATDPDGNRFRMVERDA
jgi:catechol 2,3-dioxygenase-like lactoylglutathione lyase family enzyme